jgi:DNA-binding transcriptional LysR family regulator
VTGTLRASWPNLVITLDNRQTKAVLDGLADHSIDFGLVRSSAVPKTLHSRIVGHLNYRFFVPLTLISKSAEKDPARLLAKAPLATLEGSGEYTQRLQEAASRLHAPLNIALTCTTLPQICRAVRSGSYVGVLPTIASSELPTDRYAAFDLPELKALRRSLAFCWHPRLFGIRDNIERLAEVLGDAIAKRLKSGDYAA